MVSDDVLLKLLQKSLSKLKLLKILENEPCYIREISNKMKIFPSATLKHLRLLENTKLVISEEIENKKYYKLTERGKTILNRLK